MRTAKLLLTGGALLAGVYLSAQEERAGGGRAGGGRDGGSDGRRPQHSSNRGGFDRAKMQERMLEMMAQRLKLTTEETAKFKAAYKQAQEKNKAEQEKLEKQIQELRKKTQEEISKSLKEALPEAKYKEYVEMQKKFGERGRRGFSGRRGSRGGSRRGENNSKDNNKPQENDVE